MNQINFNLTNVQRQLVNAAKQTDEVGRLELELHTAGHGLVWNLDHFEVIPDQGAAQHQPLNTFCTYCLTFIHLTTYYLLI